MRERRTLPLAIGHWPSRVILAVAVLFWTYYGLRFWGVEGWMYAPMMCLGVVVAVRTILLRAVRDDKRTFRVWNMWLVLFYSIPFFKSL